MGLPIQKPTPLRAASATPNNTPHSAPNDAPNDAPNPPWCVAKVIAVHSNTQVTLLLGGEPQIASVATHVPLLTPGMTVLFAQPHDAPPLIIGAYADATVPASTDSPTAGQAPPLMQFDAATGVLTIQANQLNLQGLGAIELKSGEAVLRLNAQGEFFTQAESITQSAIGPYRVEGATIDLN